MTFETTMAALGTAALIGLVSGWMSRTRSGPSTMPNDLGCLGVLVALVAILLGCGMLLAKVLL
jgi:hypothetical protein